MLTRPEFPRSNAYDPDWVLSNQMGPNALWLAEWLCGELALAPGMRVLDLGCGKAMTSIFLAREFSVRAWAVDLWVDPTANWRRVAAAGLTDLVTPLEAEAHALPFAEGFFDAVISIDAYQYFGTDELYLGYLCRFVRPDGLLGIVVPGLMAELPGGEVPPCLRSPQSNGKVFWEDECASFHTASWWRALWQRSNRVDVRVADTLDDGWRHWRDFELALEHSGKRLFPSDAEAIDADRGRTLGFVRLAGTARPTAGPNLYEPGLLARFEPPPISG